MKMIPVLFDQGDVLKWHASFKDREMYRYTVDKVVFGKAEIIYQVSCYQYGELVGVGAILQNDAHHQLEKANATRAVYTQDDCLEDSYRQNYKNQVLVVQIDQLAKPTRIPENQLWKAKDGFGCSPDAVGRAIYATALYDGEECRWDRNHFWGILKPELMPVPAIHPETPVEAKETPPDLEIELQWLLDLWQNKDLISVPFTIQTLLKAALEQAIVAERQHQQWNDLRVMIQDIEYQCQQAMPHPALLGIIATLNTIKKIIPPGEHT